MTRRGRLDISRRASILTRPVPQECIRPAAAFARLKATLRRERS